MGTLSKRSLRTVVVGGGPGGLFYAALAGQRFPSHEVVVYERNPSHATFGFGVVFSEQTLSGLGVADPALHAAIESASVRWRDIEVRRGETRMRCGGHGFSAISRKELLAVLRARAVEVGVELRFETEADEDAIHGADLVVAADGINSLTRTSREGHFSPRFEVGRARYIWFATPQPFDALTFIFAENEHGSWGVHAYRYAPGASTFIVETDEETWRRAGLDGAEDLPPAVSDMATLRYCEELFAAHLGGHGLLENNSKWLTFRTLSCDRWHDGKMALVGDAAHTAHFSIGSGTKMALEDAIALADSVEGANAVDEALVSYAARRRPAVLELQAAANPSVVWWERFRWLAERSDEQFAFHFLTRTPSVTRARLKARDWRFVHRVEQQHAEMTAGIAAAGPLAAPFDMGGTILPSRLVVAPAPGVEPLASLGGPALAGAGLVLAAPGDDYTAAINWVSEQSAAVVGIHLPSGATANELSDLECSVAAMPLEAVVDVSVPAACTILGLIAAPVDPRGPAGDLLIQTANELASRMSLLMGIAPPRDTPAGRTYAAQLQMCDRIKQETGLPTLLVGGAPTVDAAATAVLAGRADLVHGAGSLVSELWHPGGLAVASAIGESMDAVA